MTHPWAMVNNCVKYYPDPTQQSVVMAPTQNLGMCALLPRPWVKVRTHPCVKDSNPVKYYPIPTWQSGDMSRTQILVCVPFYLDLGDTNVITEECYIFSGYFAYGGIQNETIGSFFITTLCEELNKIKPSHKKSIIDIMCQTHQRLASKEKQSVKFPAGEIEYKTIPCFIHTLRNSFDFEGRSTEPSS